MALLKALFPWGPVFFGIGFLAPLIATVMAETGIAAPIGLTEIQLGLIIGASLGLIAKFRGSWV